MLFINRKFIEIIQNKSFNGISGHISFENGPSRKSLVKIDQFLYNYTAKEASYHRVGFYDPDAPEGELV